jgi:hypothetical protein
MSIIDSHLKGLAHTDHPEMGRRHFGKHRPTGIFMA